MTKLLEDMSELFLFSQSSDQQTGAQVAGDAQEQFRLVSGGDRHVDELWCVHIVEDTNLLVHATVEAFIVADIACSDLIRNFEISCKVK